MKMLLAVLRLSLILVTILVADVYSACLFQKTCPCGASGKNYTRCYNTTIKQYSCERWSNCKTCDSNHEFCVTCPLGRSGLTCKDGPCPFVKRPKYGVIQCSYDSHSFKSCTARCFPGYHFENQRKTKEITLNCERNAWSPDQNIPECKPDGSDCSLRMTGSGFYNCTTGMDGTNCDVTCSGKRQGRYHCYPGRGWNSTLPDCVLQKEQQSLQLRNAKVKCPDPGIPKDGDRMDLKGNSIPSQHMFMEGDAVLYYCKGRNATSQEITYLTCKPDATWAGILPRCETSQQQIKVRAASSCNHPGVVENGIIEDFESDTEQFPVGTELRFLCREGYQIQGPEAIYCLLNLSWSEAPPVCSSPPTTASPSTLQLTCKHPGSVENGFIVDDVAEIQNFPLGSILRFQCNESHELMGADVIYCLQGVNHLAYWSDVPPFCKYVPTTTTPQTIPEVYCKNPGVVANGRIENYPPQTGRFPIGSALKFACEEGYELEGPTNLYCMRNGEWSRSPPNCKLVVKTVATASCARPGRVENGKIEGDLSKSSFPPGTALTFRCSEGPQREGPMVIYCLHTGKWSKALPICKSVLDHKEVAGEASQLKCKHPGRIENGEIEYSESKVEFYTVGSEIKFKCREGYTIDGVDTLRCQENGEWTPALPMCRPTRKIPDCGRTFQEIYNLFGKYSRSDWPWTVSIGTVPEDDVEKMFCGGALLNSRTVLTAAHCATSARNINLHFGYRHQRRTGVPLPEQVRTVDVGRVIIHPEYDDETHDNDIAVIKLKHHVYYDRRTQPVCLPTPTLDTSGKNLHPGTKAVVTGFGLRFAANHSSTVKFSVLEFPVQDRRTCDEVCKRQGSVFCGPNTFCAGHPKDADECVYGGSPLVVYHPEKDRYTLEGLVSRAESARNRWNGRCKRPEIYTTFTNVTYFMPFIMEHLNSKID